MKILIIEDDLSIAELQRDYLEVAGFSVAVETNGEAGLFNALANEYDLIIVDIMLPGKNGFEICREIRKQKEIPLLVVSARGNDIDKVRALGLGADDYMVKPFSPSEMVARVQAHIARYQRIMQSVTQSEPTPQEIISAGDISINLSSRKVFVGNQEIVLPNKEFDLLLFLVQHLETVLSKEEILNSVWGVDACVETATVAVHVNRLREKIEKDPSSPHHIQTVWGIGYRFTI